MENNKLPQDDFTVFRIITYFPIFYNIYFLDIFHAESSSDEILTLYSFRINVYTIHTMNPDRFNLGGRQKKALPAVCRRM